MDDKRELQGVDHRDDGARSRERPRRPRCEARGLSADAQGGRRNPTAAQRSNAAIAELNGVFPWMSRSLEALFILVGERELAERIRTSRRRVTRRPQDGEDGDGSGDVSLVLISHRHKASPASLTAESIAKQLD